MENCIVCDWLQVHVTLPFYNYETAHKSSVFDIVKMEHGTQQFKSLFYIHNKENGEEVAVIAAHPRSEMMLKSDSGILKIVNKYLYQKDLGFFVKFLLKELCLGFVNITQIACTMDFERFDTMECTDFINNFADRNFLKKNISVFKLMGNTWSVDKGKMTNGYESLKFGKESSDVTYQLYNKSLEMASKLHKPWIQENWEAHGYNGKNSVWRLEFTLHSDTRGIVLDDGEVLFFNDLSMIDRLTDMFTHCFSKYFKFVYAEKTKKGNYKKQSRSKPVTLFHNLYMSPVIHKVSGKKDAGKSAKIFTKNLMKLQQELRGQSFDLAIMGNELMTWVIKTRNLENWAKKKLPQIHLADRICEIVQRGKNSELDIAISEAKKSPVLFDKYGKSVR